LQAAAGKQKTEYRGPVFALDFVDQLSLAVNEHELEYYFLFVNPAMSKKAQAFICLCR
jgi:hypothetical protein